MGRGGRRKGQTLAAEHVIARKQLLRQRQCLFKVCRKKVIVRFLRGLGGDATCAIFCL